MNLPRLRSSVAVFLCGWMTVASSAGASPEEAARALIHRLVSQRASSFTLESIPADEGRDVFEIESRGDRIVLRGNNGVSLASAFNAYLNRYAHAQVTWRGDQLSLPDPLPWVAPKVRQVSQAKYRYCFNYCTFSYAMAWWDWPQWERMIDWMALHGINLPLAVTGQEAVWQRVYRSLGLSDEEIRRFFVGPAYLPFGWMGCLDGWGGPLPDSWIRRHADLQRRILARERELGMKPVLQGFTGHVPPGLTNVFPQARLQRLPSWCDFPPTYFLSPRDPLFAQVGRAFVEEQARQFGTDHLYASDTFIEMVPPSSEPAFLADMGRAILAGMQAGDDQAVWLLQGWIFVNQPNFWKPPQARALLGSVPDDRMIVLDLYCENTPVWPLTEAFHGKPWIACILHNFGGLVGMYGNLPRMGRELERAMTDPKRGDCQGIGLTFEGTDHNPPVQEYVTEMAWQTQAPPLKKWVVDYSERRYGKSFPETAQAWEILRTNYYVLGGPAGSLLTTRPRLETKPEIPARLAHAQRAWELLMSRATDLGGLETYRFDVVNLTREILAGLAQPLVAEASKAFEEREADRFASASQRLLALFDDLDRLLATDRHFLLGAWLEDAKRWAQNDSERQLYEWNARNLITLWGPRDSILHEYAARQWSGLMAGFYRGRWELFLSRLDEAIRTGAPPREFEPESRVWEERWTHGVETYPATPQGDALDTARRLMARYKGMIPSGEKAAATETTPTLIPRPATLIRQAGCFELQATTRVTAHPGTEAAAQRLAEALRGPTGFELAVSAQARDTDAIDLSLDASLARGLGREGYALTVSPRRIEIQAPAEAGLDYAAATLRQLFPPEACASRCLTPPESWTAPCVVVRDSPRFAWRGLLLDVARHFMPVADVKRFIDTMAFHKFNLLQLHLTDDQGWRVEIRKYPRLTEVGATRKESPKRGDRNRGDGTPYGPFFYTQAELRELVAYAQARQVTLLPEIELPGHLLAALTAYPEFSCRGGPFEVRTRWGIEPDILCVGNDRACEFARDILTEIVAIFPGTFIHIGGDEAPRDRWRTCPKCQARLKAEGLANEAQLQSWLNHRLEDYLTSQGRRLIGWDEILEGGLTPNAAVMSWRGTEGGLAAARQGHDVVMSPTSHCYFDYAQSRSPGEPESIGGDLPLERVYGFEPIPVALPPEQRAHILGAQGNLWTEYIGSLREAEYFAYPRAAALAEVLWSPPAPRDFDDFQRRLGAHERRLDRMGVNYRPLGQTAPAR